MPCRDYESDSRYDQQAASRREKELKTSLDARTKMLCEVLDKLSDKAMLAIKMTDEEREWYAKHKEQDRMEQAKVQFEKDKKVARKAAIRKFRKFTQELPDLERSGLKRWLDEQEYDEYEEHDFNKSEFIKYYREGLKNKSWK